MKLEITVHIFLRIVRPTRKIDGFGSVFLLQSGNFTRTRSPLQFLRALQWKRVFLVTHLDTTVLVLSCGDRCFGVLLLRWCPWGTTFDLSTFSFFCELLQSF